MLFYHTFTAPMFCGVEGCDPAITQLDLKEKTPNRGGWVLVEWTVPDDEWELDAAILDANPGPFKWDVVGITNISDTNPLKQTAYSSAQEPFDLIDPELIPTFFTATSPGNDTLDLGYDIVTPGSGPGGTLTSMTVSLYTSASGVFGDQDNRPLGFYANGDLSTQPATFTATGSLLYGTDQKVFQMDASWLNSDDLEYYTTNDSDFYILAEINTTAGSGADAYSDTQWVRLQVGAFEIAVSPARAYVMGTASLDDPTPDDNTADQITIAGSEHNVVVTGPADDGNSLDTFTRVFNINNAIEVRGHGGDDTIDASGFDGNPNAPPNVWVLGGEGCDAISASHGENIVVAGPGGYNFTNNVGGEDTFVFAGDSPLGTSTITENTYAFARLDLTRLGAGVNLDLGSGGDLGGLGSLSLSLGASPSVQVLDTAYDDTITVPANLSATLYGGNGNDTFIIAAGADVQVCPGAGFNCVEINDPTGNPSPPTIAGIRELILISESGTSYTFYGGGGNVSGAGISAGADVTVGAGTQLDLGGDPVSFGDRDARRRVDLRRNAYRHVGDHRRRQHLRRLDYRHVAQPQRRKRLRRPARHSGAWTSAATSRSRAQTISAAARPSSPAARSNWPVPRHCLRRGRSRSWAAARWRWSAARTIGRGPT